MIKCPFCHTAHVDNTVFCSECGSYLLDDNKRETDQLEAEETRWVGDPIYASQTASTAPAGPRPLAIRLKIGETKREVEVQLNKAIHIGRVDPASDIYPDIDLSSESNAAKNISRRHARILKQADSVVVEDLGSINGTFINGKRLDSYLPEVLSDGDKLQLGTLLLEVSIVKR